MRFFWFTEKLLTTGVEEHTLDGCTIKIFDVEKTLDEILRYYAMERFLYGLQN